MTESKKKDGVPLPEEFRAHLREAIDRLSEEIASLPVPAYELIRRAVTYRMLGEFERAMVDHDRAVASYPFDPTVWYSRGTTLLQSEQLMAAARDFDRAAGIDPWDVEMHYRRIASHMALGHWRQATEAFDAFVDPQDEELERRLRHWATA